MLLQDPPEPAGNNTLDSIPLTPGLEAYREPPATDDAVAPRDVAPVADVGAVPVSNPPPAPSELVSGQPYDVTPPPLTLPGAPDVSNSIFSDSAVPPPAIGTLDALAIPAASALEKGKKDRKPPSWQQPLKPSHVPVRTNYNFRRVTLPSTIYRDRYDPANRQLPVAQTGALYDHYFLLAVARDDLNGIRAMLANGYRDVNLFNAEGDTALIVAIRHNAIAAARLLIARGADPNLTGKGGFSAYDYARQLNNPELNAALEGIFG